MLSRMVSSRVFCSRIRSWSRLSAPAAVGSASPGSGSGLSLRGGSGRGSGMGCALVGQGSGVVGRRCSVEESELAEHPVMFVHGIGPGIEVRDVAAIVAEVHVHQRVPDVILPVAV